jgi:hypothetical protein
MLPAEALTAALTGIVLPSVLVIFLTFVPSIVEWKRPRDSGPRPIPGFYTTGIIIPKNTLFDLESEVGAILVPKGFSFPAFIRNIEATFT